MAGTGEVDELLAAAHAEARSVDWTTWQVPPGDARLAEYLFANEPPLTNGLLATYLMACGWIWQRAIAPDEQQRASDSLVALWTEHGLAMDFEPLSDVISVAFLPGHVQGLPPDVRERVRQELLALVPDGRFPGVDVPVPGADAAASARQARIPASALRPPTETGTALDGLYRASTFGLQLDIYGPPGSGTWGSTEEFYAFFPDGSYLYFPSGNEVGARLLDPVGHAAYEGRYEVSDASIQLYDGSNGQTNTSDFAAEPDGRQLTFYGKTFTWVSDTTGLRPAAPR
jgi:hypothetical protein